MSNNIKINLREDDTEVGDYVIYKEVFVDEVYKKIRPYIKKAKIVFDIGANIGLFILKYNCSNKVKWHAFEPESSNYNQLIYNLNSNGITNVHSNNIGLIGGDKTYIGDLYLSDSNNGGHSLSQYSLTSKSQKVTFFGIDAYIKNNNIKRIDVCKIDCEGGEFDILLNSPVFIKIVNSIIVELHYFEGSKIYTKPLEQIIIFLEKHRFSVEVIENNEYTGEGIFYLLLATKDE